ncbi:methionyl-tRNA formyltransferase [Peptoniphilus sp. MSJ-1]|uniref:Methionyl-tRNA formyltransferase n=1 Tax=Peptoniphilus ovalis TaxID=2841503 RepID=A0ABS6FHZ9_9FIRM|nr:methionyl-tRNA formyltransferase [Peptoniphilus ovalis]MBU5669122.1 methionyl-tRNA formyltransferase [Peptoniphilus ovalis]
MRYIFMGTPEFSIPILERLNSLGDVSLVISQEDKKKGRGKKVLETPVKKKALELGLEVYQPADVNSEESIEKIKSLKPDIIVVVAYGQIISKDIIDIPNKYIINVHASILPKLRGAAPINRAIMEGFDKTGVSLMRVEEGLDTGAVANIYETEIGNKNAGELEEELSNLGADLLEDFIKNVENDEVSFTPQDDAKSTYANKILKSDLNLDFNKNSKDIVNIIRGLSPHYGARINYKDKIYKIYDAQQFNYNSDLNPGLIIKSKDELVIKTLDGAIKVLKIQAPGKKVMDIEDFLRGNSFDENYLLGGN